MDMAPLMGMALSVIFQQLHTIENAAIYLPRKPATYPDVL